MKQLTSIVLSLFILLSGITLHLSTHYCSGNFIGSRLSLAGKYASCGMNIARQQQKGETSISRLCCENTRSSFSFPANYFPTIRKPVDQNVQSVSPAFATMIIPVSNDITSEPAIYGSPPGLIPSNRSQREFTCIYRI